MFKKVDDAKLENLKEEIEEVRGFGGVDVFQLELEKPVEKITSEVIDDFLGFFKLERGTSLEAIPIKEVENLFMEAGTKCMAYGDVIDRPEQMKSYLEEFFEIAGGRKDSTFCFTNHRYNYDEGSLRNSWNPIGLATFEVGLLIVNGSLFTLLVFCDED